jgi:catechol 2,3-dioxygenase-like lactoylglutathione lyase family enzyme
MASNIILTIPTVHLEESVTFYRDVLQFSLKERMDRPQGVVLMFLSHPCGFVLEFVAGPHIQAGEVGPGAPLLTFMTQDFVDIQNRLASAGIPAPEPVDLPSGISMLRFKDPNGVMISFVAGELRP